MFELLPILSQALLWPVVALLLAGVIASVVLAGGLGGESISRRRWSRCNRATVAALVSHASKKMSLQEIQVALARRRLAGHNLSEHSDFDKLLDDFQLSIQRDLSRINVLVRLGPMLGLAGTLIPLGPGLAALSNGNVDALSDALVIAFTSTVLGLFVGGICFAIHSVRRHWYAKDLADLEFFFRRLDV